MACLDTTSKSLTIELTGSPTTQVQWTVHYATRSGTDFTESSNDGVTNSTTPVTMIAAPSSGETISIRDITVYNADVSSVTIVIKLVNGGNSRVLYRQALDTLESWSSLAQKGKDGAQGLTGSVSAASGLILDESSAPNTATNQGALYVPVADNLLRYRGESNGTERRIALIDTTNLATNDLFYYGSDGLFKPIGIGTLDQVLLAKPSSNPPYQWATPTSREVLTANRTYYVRTDGNDANNGLTDTSGGAFLTPHKVADVIGNLDISIYDVTVQFGNGTYTITSSIRFKPPQGSGTIYFQGNATTPSNVIITSSTSLTNGLFWGEGANTPLFFVRNMRLSTTGLSTSCIALRKNFSLIYSGIDFNACTGQHINLLDAALCFCDGNYTISGGAIAHWGVYSGSSLRCQSKTITISGTPNFSIGFFASGTGGQGIVNGNTYSGSATGKQFEMTGNSVLQLASGTLPGNANGTNTTGAEVV